MSETTEHVPVIKCDSCNEVFRCPWNHDVTLSTKEARVDAAEYHNWVNEDDKDYCDDCAKLLKKGKGK